MPAKTHKPKPLTRTAAARRSRPPLRGSTAAAPSVAAEPRFTSIEYDALEDAYDFFNKELFGGALPDCFIAYQRKPHMRGHFASERYSGRSGDFKRSELALNPDSFIGRTDEEICSTLVHEQVHVWQFHFGKPPSRGYHNREWGAKMKSVGLYPSNTGGVGGKETGVQMTHYIIPDGAFASSYDRLAATGWKLNLQSTMQGGPDGGKSSKTKFTCLLCGQNAWGKPELAVDCHLCQIVMHAAA